jgi:tellurite resistance protein
MEIQEILKSICRVATRNVRREIGFSMEIQEILKSMESRCSFLTGLVFISKADGVIEDEEKVFFQRTAETLGLNEDSINFINSCWGEKQRPQLTFNDSTEKRFFLRQAIELCSVDGHYDNAERKLVHEFASELGIPDQIVAALEDWVAEGMKWQAEGDKLIMEGQ